MFFAASPHGLGTLPTTTMRRPGKAIASSTYTYSKLIGPRASRCGGVSSRRFQRIQSSVLLDSAFCKQIDELARRFATLHNIDRSGGMRMDFRLLCLLGAALPGVVVAQTANVTINAGTPVQTVDDRLFGANSTLWDSALGTPQTQSLLQAAGIRAIRLPGGSLSDEYHWRINKNRDNSWIWSSGFNVSSTLTSSLAAHAMITVNYGSGTPEEAAAWVAYANFPASGGTDVVLGPDNPAPGTATSPTVGSYDWKTAQTWADLRAATPLATDDGMNFLRAGRSAPFGFKYWEVG